MVQQVERLQAKLFDDAPRRHRADALDQPRAEILFQSLDRRRQHLLAVLGLGLGPAWLGVCLAVWAPLVMLARVAMGVHYLLDVVAGALLGGLMGLAVLSLVPLLAALF
jgi:hypothetical protein